MFNKKIKSCDGLLLDVYANPFLSSYPTIIFLNNYGVSSKIAELLANVFHESGVNFVTWDTRGTPGRSKGRDFERYDVDVHEGDLKTIIEKLGIQSYVVLGWCGSCQVAISHIANKPQGLKGAIFVSGYYGFEEKLSTKAGSSIMSMAEMVALDEPKSKIYYELLNSKSEEENRDIKDQAEGFKKSPKDLYIWSCMQAHLLNSGLESRSIDTDVPVQIIGGGKDEMIAGVDVEAIKRVFKHLEITVFPDADHYMLFNNHQVQQFLISKTESWSSS